MPFQFFHLQSNFCCAKYTKTKVSVNREVKTNKRLYAIRLRRFSSKKTNLIRPSLARTPLMDECTYIFSFLSLYLYFIILYYLCDILSHFLGHFVGGNRTKRLWKEDIISVETGHRLESFSTTYIQTSPTGIAIIDDKRKKRARVKEKFPLYLPFLFYRYVFRYVRAVTDLTP